MYYMRYYSPDEELIVGRYAYGLVVLVVWNEPTRLAVWVATKLFDGEFAIDEGNNVTAVVRLDGFVNDCQVAIEDACVLHAVAFHAGEECCFGTTNQHAIQVDAIHHVIRGRRWKACVDGVSR